MIDAQDFTLGKRDVGFDLLVCDRYSGCFAAGVKGKLISLFSYCLLVVFWKYEARAA